MSMPSGHLHEGATPSHSHVYLQFVFDPTILPQIMVVQGFEFADRGTSTGGGPWGQKWSVEASTWPAETIFEVPHNVRRVYSGFPGIPWYTLVYLGIPGVPGYSKPGIYGVPWFPRVASGPEVCLPGWFPGIGGASWKTSRQTSRNASRNAARKASCA